MPDGTSLTKIFKPVEESPKQQIYVTRDEIDKLQKQFDELRAKLKDVLKEGNNESITTD